MRYSPGNVDVQVPAPAPVGPSTQKTRNSFTVWYSTWLSFISMSLSMTSSPSDSAPNVFDGYSMSGMMPSLVSLEIQHSQMPSPAEPRFCLTTRGWNAIVFLNWVSRVSAS